jgi:alkaline phosphatase D
MIVEPLTVGPIVGHTTSTTCRLWGRGPDAAGARVFGVARAFRADTGQAVGPAEFKMLAKFDYTGVTDLPSLAAEKEYRYEIGFVRGDADWEGLPPGTPLDWSRASRGAFRTCAFPGAAVPVSFVFGSCRYLLLKWILHWGEESGDKAFRSILAQMDAQVRTDCLLMVGDQIYADDLKGVDPDDHLDEFLARYRIAFGQPFIRELMGRLPTYMTLDDHEIKDAWTMDMRPGRETLYAAAMSAYQSYQVVHGPAFDPSGPDAGMARTPTRYWYTYEIGPARFFVLDTRNERFVALSGADPQIISSIQMSALLQWLEAGPPGAVKFVVTSVPMFPDDRSEIGDKWAGFPRQRLQLLNAIRELGVGKVVFLAGDVHCSGWSELRCVADPAFRVYSVISSPFFFPGPRLGQGDRFDLGATIPNPPNDFVIARHGPVLGDDAFTRVSVDAAATSMRVDVYDRKGGLLDGTALPL